MNASVDPKRRGKIPAEDDAFLAEVHRRVSSGAGKSK